MTRIKEIPKCLEGGRKEERGEDEVWDSLNLHSRQYTNTSAGGRAGKSGVSKAFTDVCGSRVIFDNALAPIDRLASVMP